MPKKISKEKKTRKPNTWALYVKEHYHDPEVQALPPKQRFKKLSEMRKRGKAGAEAKETKVEETKTEA